jgi:hypothetical protein
MIDNGSLRYYLAQPDLQGMKLHIVVSPPEFNVKISAIYVESRQCVKVLDMRNICEVLSQLTYDQVQPISPSICQ